MSSSKITSTHDDYEDIHDAWVENGRPSQFDREGSFGGAVYHVLDTSLDEPDFYIAFSKGPTEISSKGRISSKGWHTVNEDYMKESIKVHSDGRVSVEAPEFP